MYRYHDSVIDMCQEDCKNRDYETIKVTALFKKIINTKKNLNLKLHDLSRSIDLLGHILHFFKFIDSQICLIFVILSLSLSVI